VHHLALHSAALLRRRFPRARRLFFLCFNTPFFSSATAPSYSIFPLIFSLYPSLIFLTMNLEVSEEPGLDMLQACMHRRLRGRFTAFYKESSLYCRLSDFRRPVSPSLHPRYVQAPRDSNEPCDDIRNRTNGTEIALRCWNSIPRPEVSWLFDDFHLIVNDIYGRKGWPSGLSEAQFFFIAARGSRRTKLFLSATSTILSM